jgi:hypothetical protein
VLATAPAGGRERYVPDGRSSWGFVGAGVVAVIGLLLEELGGITDFDMWPWLVASGIGYSIGLAGFAVDLDVLSARSRKAGRAFAVLAGIGASSYVLVTLVFRGASLVGASLPDPLEGLFLLGALAFLVGVFVASLVIGVGVLRSEADTTIAVLMLGSAIAFWSPLPDLLGMGVPPWVAPTIVAALATAVFALGYLLRSPESVGR